MTNFRTLLRDWLRDNPREQQETLKTLERAGLITKPTPSDIEGHYQWLFERARKEADWNQARLFDSWRVIHGQAKGLRRQRRLIKRLQAENAQLRDGKFGDSPERSNDRHA